MPRRLFVALAMLAFLAIPASAARADGDPASDVLSGQRLYLPTGAGVPASQQAQLEALLATLQRAGDPIRVAVIASAADLGSVGELWGRPALYAKFLGQELRLTYRGALIVVMPGGVAADGVAEREARALAGISAPANGLGAASLAAVTRLAALTGHPITAVAGRPPAGAPPGSSLSWVLFVLGLVAVAGAWTLSLRARPLGAGRR